MEIIKNWIKGGLLITAIPCIMVAAISVGTFFHILGINKETLE